ncbi:hydrolase [Pseudohongiella nitratireducens]|uniref:Hydrolase n=1 Tax=Pseudohongiella nitratireducens TaxID=1768907 RepID=A0A917GW68_9GAMM|nr:dienelactone hydrolase family protein [Pseudohongiella nitratireducens]MDF1623826.1 dienelactone hydrolase family protein [Pseudohongiella nitratireducens]GGG58448.1 hydrolase [Pseudohongiella nitratireducens]
MCDQDTVNENDAYLKRNPFQSSMNRRQFGKLTAGAAAAFMLPPLANAQDVVENDVMIETPDGTADCYFVHPANGSHAAVLMWPDILGLRPAFRTMGKRLAQSGYSVLVVNPFYRSAKSPVVEEGESFGDPETREKVMPMARALNAQTHVTDAHAFVDWLDQQSAVDTSRKIGTMGYCMGGPMVMRTAAAIPERIGAGGSFHGGGLVTDNADSPHLGIENMEAHMWIAIAENDDERDPQAKEVLMDTFEETGVMAEIEVFEGAMHGWCVIDSTVYNEAQAERAWNRMLGIFETAL